MEEGIVSEEALQRAERRREAKGKGERERDTQLNAEFQRIARRDKEAFFNEQCKENNRMGKTRDLVKKIGDTKGTFHAKMDTIKDRNGKDLIGEEEIKKRWQGYTEQLLKKKGPNCRGPALVDPGNLKRGWRQRGSGNNCLIKR